MYNTVPLCQPVSTLKIQTRNHQPSCYVAGLQFLRLLPLHHALLPAHRIFECVSLQTSLPYLCTAYMYVHVLLLARDATDSRHKAYTRTHTHIPYTHAPSHILHRQGCELTIETYQQSQERLCLEQNKINHIHMYMSAQAGVSRE